MAIIGRIVRAVGAYVILEKVIVPVIETIIDKRVEEKVKEILSKKEDSSEKAAAE